MTNLCKILFPEYLFSVLFKKSIYFDNETIRDYVFKGYTCVYEIDVKQNVVNVFGFIKYKQSL